MSSPQSLLRSFQFRRESHVHALGQDLSLLADLRPRHTHGIASTISSLIRADRWRPPLGCHRFAPARLLTRPRQAVRPRSPICRCSTSSRSGQPPCWSFRPPRASPTRRRCTLTRSFNRRESSTPMASTCRCIRPAARKRTCVSSNPLDPVPHLLHHHAQQVPPAVIPDAAQREVWKSPYSYGYFGASGTRRWTRHHGYRDRGKEWRLRIGGSPWRDGRRRMEGRCCLRVASSHDTTSPDTPR